jgi:hypothetical protein
MKAILSNKNITTLGGIVPVLKSIKEYGIPQVIRSSLKQRRNQARYGYDDIILGWVLTTLNGGTRLEHISKLKKKFSIVPRLKLPSHDALGRGMKQLSSETLISESITKHGDKTKIVTSEYNDNISLNRMLVRTTKRIGALKEGPKYTLDIDATFLHTERRGAKRSIKKNGKIDYTKIGFTPMVALIGDLPVNISLRNGNSGSRFRFYEFLENTLKLLEESKISVGRLVSDAAGYNKRALLLLDKKGIKFNIRFHFNKKMAVFKKKLADPKYWRKTEIETANHIWQCDIADIPYTMSKERKYHPEVNYRVVAMRIPTETTRRHMDSIEQIERRAYIKERMKELSRKKVLKELAKPYEDRNWKTIGRYSYKFYVTNDFKKSAEEIIKEYNRRGDAERKFSFMKNDFGWSLPPFMNLNENNVFLIVSALANNIFRGVVKLFRKVFPGLRLNARLPEFKFTFIEVSCEHIDPGIYVFYSKEEGYVKLME